MRSTEVIRDTAEETLSATMPLSDELGLYLLHVVSGPVDDKEVFETGQEKPQPRGKGKSHCSAKLLSRRRSHIYDDGTILKSGRPKVSRSSRCWNKAGANADIRRRNY